MFEANLLILIPIYDKLLCWQGKVYERTDGKRWTEAGNDNTLSAWGVKMVSLNIV